MKEVRGFSLIELMIALTILGLLIALAAPAFGRLVLAYQTESSANTLASDLQRARALAIESNRSVRVTFDAETGEFLAQAVTQPDLPVLRRTHDRPSVNVTSFDLTFRGDGRLTPAFSTAVIDISPNNQWLNGACTPTDEVPCWQIRVQFFGEVEICAVHAQTSSAPNSCV